MTRSTFDSNASPLVPRVADTTARGVQLSSAIDVQQLTQLLTRQIALFEVLHNLAKQQSCFLAAQQHEEVLPLLDQRQKVVEQLQALEPQFLPYRQSWAQWLPHLTEQQRKGLVTLVDRASELRTQILMQDQQDIERVRSAQKNISLELSENQRSANAVQSYARSLAAPSSIANPFLTDQRG